MTQAVPNYISGQFVTPSSSLQKRKLLNPATLELLGEVPLCTAKEVDDAVQAAKAAFTTWSETPVVDRIQPLFKYKMLLEKHQEEIATILTKEHGKTLKEALGDVRRGIQNVETACGMPTMMMGQGIEDIARGIDCTAFRQPLGVFAAITPFNFPAMVPFWFWPYAVATGNTFVLKPSELVPLTQVRLFELLHDCGLPAGVMNMVQGGKDVVNAICTHPDIKGVSFVGSTPVAKHVYTTGTATGKRVQALGGAKNFMVVTPDADMKLAINALGDSCFGCAGERCLAGSVLVAVGSAYEPLRDGIVAMAKSMVVGDGLNPKTVMGPVINAEAKQRILNDIDAAVKEGAEILVDGRNVKTGLDGYFIGPTVFDKVRPGTLLTNKEIFGPVVAIMRTNTLEEAIQVINNSPYANTTSIFTTSGGNARAFSHKVRPSMVGVNLGVPAPMSFFSFGGTKDSFFGDLKAHGPMAIDFYTDRKVTMTRWPS